MYYHQTVYFNHTVCVCIPYISQTECGVLSR